MDNRSIATFLFISMMLVIKGNGAPTSNTVNKLSPVILVPGNGGSRIEAKLNKTSSNLPFCTKVSDWYSLWLNMKLLLPELIKCWIDNIKLHYDIKTRTTSNQAGVKTRIPGWGNPEFLEELDPDMTILSTGQYFKSIVDTLVENGYVRNQSIRGAPYDFRKGPNENTQWFTDIKTLVEETYNINDNTPVTLLCHSMGCPMSLLLLQNQTQTWKDQYISKLISIAGAWGGTVKTVKLFAVGDDLGALPLREYDMRQVQMTMPSSAFLLPSPNFWNSSDILVTTSNRSYTVNDLEDFFKDINYTIGYEMRKDMLPYTDFTAPNVEVHCIFGNGVPTLETLNFPTNDMSLAPNLETGDGDGTINIRSLKGCRQWRKTQDPEHKPVKELKVYKGEHSEILHLPEVHEYILRALLD